MIEKTKPSKRNPPPPFATYAPLLGVKGGPVTAVQWLGGLRLEINRFCGRQIIQKSFSNRELWVTTADGPEWVKVGDWVVKHEGGHLDVLTGSEFWKRYALYDHA